MLKKCSWFRWVLDVLLTRPSEAEEEEEGKSLKDGAWSKEG